MTIQDIAQIRLAAQAISGAGTPSPLEVVQHMGCMQAQDYYGSVWAIGLRSKRTEKDVIAAIESSDIVRTWPQRGTLHFVPSADAGWLVSLSADRLIRGAKRRRENLGLDDTTFERSQAVLASALAAGPLSRPKVMEVLESAGISTKDGRGYHILWYLSQTGVTYIGPMEGKQQTVCLLASLPEHASYSREAGVAELARRYFTSHGPAQLSDFVWWSGLTVKDARLGLETNSNSLDCMAVEGKQYWAPKTMPPVDDAARSYLLPGFDEYMLGYSDRSAIINAENFLKVVPGGNGMFSPMIVVDGQIRGTWKRTIKKDHVLIELIPFDTLDKVTRRSLQTPADQYGRFFGLPAKLV